jgi:lysophospholipase L1-like esterase
MVKIKDIKDHLLSDQRFKIVFLGDSITSAEWIHPNWREIVEYVLKEELMKIIEDWKIPSWGIRCFNSGLDGATTKDLLGHVENYVFAYQPEMVICIIGENDMHFKINPSQHKKNVERLIKRISSKTSHFVFCTSIPTLNNNLNQKYSEYVKQIEPLFPHPKVQFINLFKIYQKFELKKIFTFESTGNEVVGIKPGEVDYLHPNHLGNAYIAKVLLKEIFGIKFNPYLYIKGSFENVMYPKY